MKFFAMIRTSLEGALNSWKVEGGPFQGKRFGDDGIYINLYILK